MGLKKIIAKTDTRFFRGTLHGVYHRLKDRLKNQTAFFHNKRAVVLREPVADMLLMQLDQNENQFNRYCAYDFAVRYLAMEEYYGRNDYGFGLYKKMHTLGGNYGQINEVESYYNSKRRKRGIPVWGTGRTEQHSVEQFLKLIRSVEEQGFEEASLVMADRNLLSMNGSHRITIALWHRMDYLNVEVHNRLFQRRFSRDFFWEKGFTKEEIARIESGMEKLVRECRERIGQYYCILFPPAEKYFDEITEDIGLVDRENISVAGFADYEWETGDFMGFLGGVYYFDSILPHNLERKLSYILRASRIRENKVRFRIVSIEIRHPMYRLKADNGMPESVATVRLKEMIRGRYREREKRFTEHYVGDYAHDVIIHSSDNFISNNAFRDLLSFNRDLTAVMEAVGRYAYVIAGASPDKVSGDFPKNYYVGEDFDIFVRREDLIAVTEDTWQACRRAFADERLRVVKQDSPYGKRVRVTYRGFTLTMFDFMVSFPGIRQEYFTRFIAERTGGAFYRLSEQNELIYRTGKYLQSKEKTYHRDYIAAHKAVIDRRKMQEAFDKDTGRRAQSLWNQMK